MKTCRMPGCTRIATGWNPCCSAHKSRARRHGHPDQRAISKGDLKAHVEAVQRRIERNPENPAWGRIEARWLAAVDACRAQLRDAERGRPYVRWQQRACQEIVRLADAVPAREIAATALALYLLADAEPRRFRSDDAFLVQLSRRVRGLTDLNAGTWWDHRAGRVKRAYRDLAPRAALACGRLLADVFGIAGLYLARLEGEGRDAGRREAQGLHEALAELR